jgi:hypothetical protein
LADPVKIETLADLIVHGVDGHLSTFNIPDTIVEKYEDKYCRIHDRYHFDTPIWKCKFCCRTFCDTDDVHNRRIYFGRPLFNIWRIYGKIWCGVCENPDIDGPY